MKKLAVVSVLAGLVLPSAALAVWTSGGGEIFKDANNPWFLDNVTAVKYCIEMDEANVSASKAKVEELVAKGFAYWKEDIKKGIDPKRVTNKSSVKKPVIVATQEFQYIPNCGSHTEEAQDDIDLRIKIGVLTGHEMKQLGDTKRFISIAVRTSYDEVNLKGKGFIYISPDKGPLKFEGTPGMVDVPWSRDGLLQRVIAHELGHVFGVRHTLSSLDLMGEGHLEEILKKEYADYYSVKPLESYFRASPSWPKETDRREFCGTTVSKIHQDYLDISEDEKCALAEVTGRKMVVKVRKDKSSPYRLAGVAELSESRVFAHEYSIFVVTNPKQKVFSGAVAYECLYGPIRSVEVSKGKYVSERRGLVRSILRKPPTVSYMSFSGEYDGEIVFDLTSGW